MSLVNDALKRARAEAAEHEARQSARPLPTHVAIADGPPKRFRLTSILALLGAVFLIGLVAGAVTFVRSRSATPAETTTAETATAATPTPQASRQPAEPTTIVPPTAASTAPPSTPVSKPVPPSRAEPAADAPAPADARAGSARPVTPAPSRRPASAAREASPALDPGIDQAVEPATPVRSRRTPGDATVAGVRSATALDGRLLELGGIAWSDSGPFALINGRVLAAGERIEGFEIVEIEREWVQLEDGDETVVLKLR